MSRELLSAFATAVATVALVCMGFGAEATEKYQAYLSPMPHNDAMHANFSGKGAVVATIAGDTMSLSGSFIGLSSFATTAHVCMSMAPGIPGKPIFDFTVPGAIEGKLTGTFKLDSAQAAALKTGKLYIQIDSEKAPKGNLWGWLLGEHQVVGQDVPQKGPWFLPEFAIKTK